MADKSALKIGDRVKWLTGQGTIVSLTMCSVPKHLIGIFTSPNCMSVLVDDDCTIKPVHPVHLTILIE